MLGIPLNAPKLAGWALKQAGIPVHVKTSMFFDRARVKSALTRAELKFLSQASLLVRRTAAKSIRKTGAAKSKLKVVGLNSGLSLSQVSQLPGVPRGGGRSRKGMITEADRRKVLTRVAELRGRPPSAPGTPPHTHVPSGHMLGFRRNIYNAVDIGSLTAVVGPTKKGGEWWIPQLHEFGRSQTLRAWALIPRGKTFAAPIIKWVSKGTVLGTRWMPTGATKREGYPARPFMRPALEQCRPKISQFFRDAFM